MVLVGFAGKNDDLVARSLTIVDSKGKAVVTVGQNTIGGSVRITSKVGQVQLGFSKDGLPGISCDSSDKRSFLGVITSLAGEKVASCNVANADYKAEVQAKPTSAGVDAFKGTKSDFHSSMGVTSEFAHVFAVNPGGLKLATMTVGRAFGDIVLMDDFEVSGTLQAVRKN